MGVSGASITAREAASSIAWAAPCPWSVWFVGFEFIFEGMVKEGLWIEGKGREKAETYEE